MSDHPFLKRDSYLACEKLLRLRRDEVLRELIRNVGAIRGQISDVVKEQVVAAVKFAVTLSVAEKKTNPVFAERLLRHSGGRRPTASDTGGSRRDAKKETRLALPGPWRGVPIRTPIDLHRAETRRASACGTAC